ncbi:hypothetical protein BH09PAT3_BH09PAT3_0960 [soil metagenome]
MSELVVDSGAASSDTLYAGSITERFTGIVDNLRTDAAASLSIESVLEAPVAAEPSKEDVAVARFAGAIVNEMYNIGRTMQQLPMNEEMRYGLRADDRGFKGRYRLSREDDITTVSVTQLDNDTEFQGAIFICSFTIDEKDKWNLNGTGICSIPLRHGMRKVYGIRKLEGNTYAVDKAHTPSAIAEDHLRKSNHMIRTMMFNASCEFQFSMV